MAKQLRKARKRSDARLLASRLSTFGAVDGERLVHAVYQKRKARVVRKMLDCNKVGALRSSVAALLEHVLKRGRAKPARLSTSTSSSSTSSTSSTSSSSGCHPCTWNFGVVCSNAAGERNLQRPSVAASEHREEVEKGLILLIRSLRRTLIREYGEEQFAEFLRLARQEGQPLVGKEFDTPIPYNGIQLNLNVLGHAHADRRDAEGVPAVVVSLGDGDVNTTGLSTPRKNPVTLRYFGRLLIKPDTSRELEEQQQRTRGGKLAQKARETIASDEEEEVNLAVAGRSYSDVLHEWLTKGNGAQRWESQTAIEEFEAGDAVIMDARCMHMADGGDDGSDWKTKGFGAKHHGRAGRISIVFMLNRKVRSNYKTLTRRSRK